MPRPRKGFPRQSGLNAGQAAYVLERLLRDRKVTQTEINGYVAEMRTEISDLEMRLNQLREAAGIGTAAALIGVGAGAVAATVVRRGRKGGRPPGRPPGRRPGRPAKVATPGVATTGNVVKRGRKRRGAITEEQLASRQLQGRYLALVRRFPESKRAQYARVAKERGREAAIRDMQDALK